MLCLSLPLTQQAKFGTPLTLDTKNILKIEKIIVFVYWYEKRGDRGIRRIT